MAHTTLTQDLVQQLFHYDPQTGYLTWKWHPNPTWNRILKGMMVMPHHAKDGYVKVMALGKRYTVQRIAWLYHYGAFPSGQLDHINGDRRDNRIENLRDVPHILNRRNRRLPTNNKSGVMGVHKQLNGWVASIGAGDSRKYLGYFSSLDDAKAARLKAEHALDYHPNHGRSQTAEP